jgi:alpha-tubulin suppressor-like RCC1 family protein
MKLNAQGVPLTDICATTGSIVGLSVSQKIWTWGDNSLGQTGRTDSQQSQPKDIALAGSFSVASPNFTQISCRLNHVVALDRAF